MRPVPKPYESDDLFVTPEERELRRQERIEWKRHRRTEVFLDLYAYASRVAFGGGVAAVAIALLGWFLARRLVWEFLLVLLAVAIVGGALTIWLRLWGSFVERRLCEVEQRINDAVEELRTDFDGRLDWLSRGAHAAWALSRSLDITPTDVRAAKKGDSCTLLRLVFDSEYTWPVVEIFEYKHDHLEVKDGVVWAHGFATRESGCEEYWFSVSENGARTVGNMHALRRLSAFRGFNYEASETQDPLPPSRGTAE